MNVRNQPDNYVGFIFLGVILLIVFLMVATAVQQEQLDQAIKDNAILRAQIQSQMQYYENVLCAPY